MLPPRQAPVALLTFKSGVFDQCVCATRELRDLATPYPANLPLWFLDWFYVLYSSERALWQMLSLATLSPSYGLMQGSRLGSRLFTASSAR